MGAAFVLARSGHRAAVVTAFGSRLRLYRREVDPEAVLAWELSPICAKWLGDPLWLARNTPRWERTDE